MRGRNMVPKHRRLPRLTTPGVAFHDQFEFRSPPEPPSPGGHVEIDPSRLKAHNEQKAPNLSQALLYGVAAGNAAFTRRVMRV